ncbi:MAG: hypothetical protein ABFD90_15460 [Phycisphaerales bacterium]
MNTTIAVVVFMFLGQGTAPCEQAREDARTITLMPHWQKGETRRYTMVKECRKTQGATVVNGRATTPIRIEVLDTHEGGYLIGWTAGQTRVDDPNQAADLLTKVVTDLADDVTVVLHLDSRTKLQGVRNWRQLQAMARETVDATVEQAKKAGTDDVTAGKTRRQLLSMFATKQQVEMLFTRSSQVFFMPLGLEHSVGRPREYEDRLPNPFGGEPFPTRASFTVDRIDPSSDTAVITWRQEIDPVAGACVLEETMKDMAARMGKPIPAGKILDFVNVRDEASFTLHLSSGWPRHLSHTRTTIIAGASQVDSLTFTE